jgi:DNA-directed RNA polymerase subunit RPC12/RpoP
MADEEKAGAVTGRCMKCGKNGMEMKDTEEVTMKNGRKAMKGVCVECGTNMFSILGTKKAE